MELELNFTDTIEPQIDTTYKPIVKKKDNSKIIDTLRKNAESLTNQAEKINTEVSRNWTNRRQRFADSAASKKEKLLERARILNHLAEDWENDTLLPLGLENIRSGSDIEFVYFHGFPTPPTMNDGWYAEEYPARLKKANKLGIYSREDADRIKAGLICLETEQVTLEQQIKNELRDKLKEVHRMNIPGFFPTPPELIDIMIDHAELKDGMKILEPESGLADICDRIVLHDYKCDITCIERMYTLAEICKLKGYLSYNDDILETKNIEMHSFDRIIMNPPFEKGQDIEHVMFCFAKFLKHGGRLISVMSTSSITGTTKKHCEFANFRDEHHAYYIENGQAFKNSFNSTGVNSIILVVDKE